MICCVRLAAIMLVVAFASGDEVLSAIEAIVNRLDVLDAKIEASQASIEGLRHDMHDRFDVLDAKIEDERNFGSKRIDMLRSCVAYVEGLSTERVGSLSFVNHSSRLSAVSARHILRDILWRDARLCLREKCERFNLGNMHWAVHPGGRDLVATIDDSLITELLKIGAAPCDLQDVQFRVGDKVVVHSPANAVQASIGNVVGTLKRDIRHAKAGDLLIAARVRPGFSGSGSVANHAFLGIPIAELEERELTSFCNQSTSDSGSGTLLGVVVPAEEVVKVVQSAIADAKLRARTEL